jgi:hypothetical protein
LSQMVWRCLSSHADGKIMHQTGHMYSRYNGHLPRVNWLWQTRVTAVYTDLGMHRIEDRTGDDGQELLQYTWIRADIAAWIIEWATARHLHI